MKNPTLTHRLIAFLLAPLLLFSLSPPLLGAVTGRSADSSLAGTEKLLSDSSGTDTYILLSTLWAAPQALTGGITATGSSSWDFSGATGTFKTSTGINTFGGSAHNFSAVLQPTTDDAAALGTTSLGFSDLHLANGGLISWNGGEVTVTQAAGVITVAGSGAGDLRITTAGTNAASAVTVGGTQTLTNKTATSLVLNGATSSGSTAINLGGNSGTFTTPSGTNVISGLATFASDAKPAVDGTGNLGTAALSWDNLYLDTASVINFDNGNAVITHSSGILTVSTGDLRVTTAGTNAASVLTLDGTQTSSNKTFVAPVLGAATATSINGLTITSSTGTLTLTNGKTLSSANSIALAGTDSTTMTFPATSSTVMTSSLSSNSIGVANSVWGASNSLVWEGTDDTAETTLTATDATADQTVTIPNFATSYALIGSSLTTNNLSAANSIWGASNALTFEGLTADAHEISITPADATADVVYLLPDAAAASYSIMSSTLATNGVDIANSVTGTSGGLFFEGSTADTSEIKLIAADATADVIYNLPNAAAATYSLMSSSLSTNAVDVVNSVYGVSNGLMFEGATADAHEIRFTPADATADVVYLLPDAAAASYAIMSSTLATNAPNIANSVTGASNGLVFEGTADASETTISATDATADTTLTFPAKTASGTVETISVEAEAATDTITAGQLYGSVITNTGAVGAAVYTLPAPAVGMHVRIYLTVAQDVDINPADGTTILALTNAAGDAISSAAAIGNSIELIALSTTTWAAFATSGTWSDAN